MKHQTITLVKFKALSKRLSLPLCWTVGVLEGLWVFACHNARDGDLSRFSNLELAGWLEYPGDETELIDALVETGWLDRDGDSLLVHDWNEHKPNWLKGIQGRNEKEKPSCKPSRVPSAEPSSQPSSEPSTEPPNLTLPRPNQTQPNPTLPSPDLEPEPLPAAWEEVVVECAKLGMDQPELACAYAKNRGCLAAEAMAQVEHYKAHDGAWGIGLLYKVIEHLRPEKRVQWPEPSAAYVAKQRRENDKKREAESVKSRQQLAADRQKALESQVELERREREYGPQLDAMSRKELREFIERTWPERREFYLQQMPPRLPLKPGTLRSAVLSQLESVPKAQHFVSEVHSC